jgi:hypothetical protein
LAPTIAVRGCDSAHATRASSQPELGSASFVEEDQVAPVRGSGPVVARGRKARLLEAPDLPDVEISRSGGLSVFDHEDLRAVEVLLLERRNAGAGERFAAMCRDDH